MHDGVFELSSDPSIMRLSHPLRSEICGSAMPAMIREVLGERSWRRLEEEFKKPGTLTNIVLGDVMVEPGNEVLHQIVVGNGASPGGTGYGNNFPLFLSLRQAMSPQPYFVIDDTLVEMLEQTDIADDVPVAMLNPPYDRCFVELGKNRTCNLKVPNLMTGMHTLEGAYLEMGHHPTYGKTLNVMLIGSPLGVGENALDDATQMVFIPLEDGEIPLRKALEDAFHAGNRAAAMGGTRETPPQFVEHALDSVRLLMKCLLYMGLSEARKTIKKDKTDWKKSIAGLKSTAKKAKAERRGKQLVDHILITAPAEVIAASKEPRQPGVGFTTHFRRRHMRMQRYGEKLALRKLIIINSTLVHGRDPEAEPRIPEYRVR